MLVPLVDMNEFQFLSTICFRVLFPMSLPLLSDNKLHHKFGGGSEWVGNLDAERVDIAYSLEVRCHGNLTSVTPAKNRSINHWRDGMWSRRLNDVGLK